MEGKGFGMLRCGLAEVKITPEFPVRLAGGCFGQSAGVWTDLYAQVAVFEQGGTRTALVAVDLCGVAADDVVRLGAELRDRFDIGQMVVNASHTHSGPTTFWIRGGWGHIDPEYMRFLHERIVKAAGAAVERMFDAAVTVTGAPADDLSYCPEHRNSKGQIDPEVGVITIYDGTGAIRGVLVNFGCHAVCLHGYENLISADFPGYMREALGGELGRQVVALFLQGAQGDVMPMAFKGAGRGEPALGQRMGAALARAALASLQGAPAAREVEVKVGTRPVKLPFESPPSVDEVQRELARLEGELAGGGLVRELEDMCRADLEWARDALAALESGTVADALEVELVALALGEAALVTAPFELYAQIGMRIKRGSPWGHTLVLALSNGFHGYLATANAHDEQTYTTNHACRRMGLWTPARDAADVLVREATSLLMDLRG